MVMQFQKDMAHGSVTVRNQRRVIYSSDGFVVNGTVYRAEVIVCWDDNCKNGTNSFYARSSVVNDLTGKESDRVGLWGVPEEVAAKVEAVLEKYSKWNGFHPFGPWYYIENTVYLAGARDHYGLCKGESRQIRNGRTGKLCWRLAMVDATGKEVTNKPETYLDADTKPEPTGLRMEYVPWMREAVGDGKGKERELDAARQTAAWPDATDEELTAPGLEQRLVDRLPGLLKEFRAAVEELGLKW